MTSRSSPPNRHRRWVVVTVAVLVLGLHGELVVSQDTAKRPQLVEVIAKEEKLFANCDLTLQVSYELLRTEGVRDLLTRKSVRQRRIIEQDGLVYFAETESGETIAGLPINHVRLAGFDGRESRREIDGLRRPNVSGLAISYRQFPHTLLLDGSNLRGMQLSEYLARKKSAAGSDVIVTEEGEEIVGELVCTKVNVEFKGPDLQTLERRVIWLANGRQHMPIKTVAYVTAYSKTIPLEESRVVDWIDVERGLWCPRSCEIVRNYETAAAEGRIVQSTRKLLQVKHIDLKPAHDVALFRDIPKEVPGN